MTFSDSLKDSLPNANAIQVVEENDFATFYFPVEGVALTNIAQWLASQLGQQNLLQSVLPDALLKGISGVRIIRLEVAAPSAETVVNSFYMGLAWDNLSWTLLEYNNLVLLGLQDIELGLAVIDGQVSQAQVFAHARFGGVDCTMFVSLPDQSFEAFMQPGQYRLSTLLDRLGIQGDGLGSLTIDRLEFSGNGPDKTLQLALGVSDIAKPVAWLELSAFEMQISRCFDESKYTAASFECDGVLFDIPLGLSSYYDSSSGWSFGGRTTLEHPLSLTGLANRLLSAVSDGALALPPALPEVDLVYLAVDFNLRNKTFAIQADLDASHTTKVSLGAKEYDLRLGVDLTIARDEQTQKRTFVGSLTGELEFEANIFDLAVGFGQGQNWVQGSWASETNTLQINTLLNLLGIGDLLGALGLDCLPEIDTTLTELEFHYDMANQQFRLVGQSKTFGQAFFVAEKGDKGWGVVFGLSLQDKHLGDLPGLDAVPGLSDFLASVDIQPICLVYSTLTDAKFTLPALDAAAKLPGGGSLLMTPGLQIAGALALKPDSNAIIGAVDKIIHVDEVVGQLILAPNNLSTRMLLPGHFAIHMGKEAIALEDAYVGLAFASKTPTAQLHGTMNVNVFGEPHVAQCMLAVDESGAMASLAIQNGPPLPSPAMLPGVILARDYSLSLGIQFEPEGITLGYMGDFHILDNTHQGKATLVLEMIEEIPNPLYLALALNDMNLLVMFEAYTGVGRYLQAADDAEQFIAKVKTLPAPAGALRKYTNAGLKLLHDHYKALAPIFDKISLHDVAIHWTDAPHVILPDGSVVSAGVGFQGWADIFGWRTYMMVEFNPSNGSTAVLGHAEMEALAWGKVVSISGAGQGILKNNSWKPGDPPRLGNSQSQPQTDYLIKPGGPVLNLDSAHSPYLQMSLHIALFDFVAADIQAQITNDGLAFNLIFALGRLSHLAIACQINKEHFYGKAAFAFQLDLHIPPLIPGIDETSIHLNTGFDGVIEMTINATAVKLVVDGSFDFDGAELQLPTLTLGGEFHSFQQLPGYVERKILDAAHELFSDLIGTAARLLAEGVKEVEAIGKETAAAVVDIGKKSIEEAGKITQDAEKAATQVGEEVAKGAQAAKDEAMALGNSARAEAEKLAGDAEQAAAAVVQEAQQAFDAAEQAATQVAAAVVAEVGEIEHQIGAILGDAEQEAQRITAAAVDFAKNAVADAEHVAQDVLNDARKIAGKISDEAKKVWNEASALANKAKEALEHAASAVGHAVSSGFHKIFHF